MIGLATLLLLLTAVFRTLTSTVSSNDPLLAVTSTCLLAGITAFCVHGFVDKHPPGGYAPFYVMMATAVSVYVINKRITTQQ
ncbi:MAG: hypothetical protein EHM72_06365 [Calditrichaeota bacterium]|nr:MAG: hypothetical protein EHM72_06365 [Calditrichota bacterium]